MLALPPEEQYLVATGRTYFRDLVVRRPAPAAVRPRDHGPRSRGAIGSSWSRCAIRRARRRARGDRATATPTRPTLIRAARGDGHARGGSRRDREPQPARLRPAVPRAARARRSACRSRSAASGRPGLRQRAARRGVDAARRTSRRRVRFVAPGPRADRHARRRAALRLRDARAAGSRAQGRRAAPRHRAARIASYIRGDQIYATYPQRSRRACGATRPADVEEVAGARAPARRRRVRARADGAAPLRAARRRRRGDRRDRSAARARVPARGRGAARRTSAGDGTPHSGAALHLFATGVARRVVKADVASLYPSLMRAYRIGPARDSPRRAARARRSAGRAAARRPRRSARAAPAGSAERYTHEAMSAAMKLVVNSAYGYLAAGGGLTRFADVARGERGDAPRPRDARR